MTLAQVKRPRPNLQTAHRYHSEGVFSIEPGHYVSEEDRNAFATLLAEELQGLVKAEFPRTANLEHALLKCHLIIEHALVQFIRGSSHVLVDAKQLKFTFAQKLEIAYLMSFGANDPVLLPAIELLNKVRNQVAHSFILDRVLVDEMLRIVSQDYDDFVMSDDRMRVRQLRGFCTFVCAHLAGRLAANTWIATDMVRRARQDRAGQPRD